MPNKSATARGDYSQINKKQGVIKQIPKNKEMKNRKMIEFVLGCIFLIEPVWYVFFQLYAIINRYNIEDKIATSVEIVGLALVGSMLIIKSYKN